MEDIPSGDQWEILSESSTAEPIHLPNPRNHVIPHVTTDSNQDTDDDDNLSVRSLSSFVSTQSTGTEASSFANVQNVQAPTIQEPSSLIPQIAENHQMRTDRNELNQLIPSYIDIEAELQRQRELVSELKIELNVISNQRDEIRNDRDVLRETVDDHEIEIERLRELNADINRQNSRLRQLEFNRKIRDKKRKKLKSKEASITNRKGHRRSAGPAKLRFRKRRTTHRTVYCQDRKW